MTQRLQALAALVVAGTAVIGALQVLGVINVPETVEKVAAAGSNGGTVTTTTVATTQEDAEFAVTGVSVSAPSEHTGDCPVDVPFTGQITVEGAPGDVTFQFEPGDGGPPTEPETLSFDEAGSQEVSTTVSAVGEPGAQGTVSMVLSVLEPNPTESAPAEFPFHCS